MMSDTAAPAVRPAPEASDPAQTLALIQKYDERVPRYTSYPTAGQFGSGVGERQHRDWLAALPSDRPVSLYVHVPFCKTLCWYCGCHTSVVNRRGPLADYVDTVLGEIALAAAALPAGLGGGTPNLLTPEDLERLLAALGRAFVLGPGLEFAAEIDPRVLTPAWVEAAAGLGLTRASLRVQDLDEAVQAAINRHQPDELVAAAVARLRAAGVRSLNFDLIYGLPRLRADLIEQFMCTLGGDRESDPGSRPDVQEKTRRKLGGFFLGEEGLMIGQAAFLRPRPFGFSAALAGLALSFLRFWPRPEALASSERRCA